MAAKFESLEVRRLLVLATWDGGGDNKTWTQATNWAGDVLPTADDDVVIPAASAPPGPMITLPQFAHFKSLTNSRSLAMYYGAPGSILTIDTELRIKTGGSFTPAGTVDGTGTLVIEAGARFEEQRVFGSSGTGMNLHVPTINYGIVAANSGDLGPQFQNFGTLALGPNDHYGQIVNESGGVINTFYLGMTPSSNAARVGLQRDAKGVVTPAPFVNHGSVFVAGSELWTGLTFEVGAPAGTGLVVVMDSTPTIGGSWRGSRAGITLTRNNIAITTTNVPVEFDSTFAFTNGTLTLGGLDAGVRGMSPETGLKLTGGSKVTFKENVTTLALLKVLDGSSVSLTNGTHVLHVLDIEVSSSPDAFNLADGLLIHGNQPGYGRPWITATTPAATPFYADSTRGSVNGNTVTIEPNGSRYGVGYTTGAGLASHHLSHTFRSETFDDNDFVFFTTLRGDTNFDRQVNFDDLLVVAKRYRTPTSRGYADGNFSGSVTGSGTIDFDDLLTIAQNYGLSAVRQPSIKRGSIWSHDVIA